MALPFNSNAPAAATPAPAASPFRDLTPPAWEVQSTKPEVPASIRPTEVEPGFYAHAEYLMWTPRLRTLDYAFVSPTSDGTPTGKPASLKYLDKPGFQIGLGYNFSRNWDIGVSYTYFESSAHGLAAAPAAGSLYPTFTRPASVDQAGYALSSAKLKYNVFDLDAGKTLTFDECFRLRLSGGIRFANISQNQKTFYDAVLADQANFESTNRFSGAGPTFAAEMSGEVFRHWSLFGKVGGGMIVGDNVSTLGGTNNGGLTPDSSFRDTYRQVVPVMNLGLGVTYEYKSYTVRIGYDVTNWFGLIERPQYTGEVAPGRYIPRASDLSLDGFKIQFGVGF